MARVAFLGSPQLAVSTLQALIDGGHEVVLVISQPDRRRSRGPALLPTPVKQAALVAGLKVSHDALDVVGSGAELAVVVAYGRMIRPPLLGAMPLVNLHLSLLPRWRGAAPVERAILAGDEVTGVCLMALEAGLDTGPIYASIEVEVADKDLQELQNELIAAGNELLLKHLENGVAGLGTPLSQVGEPTYAAKINPAELQLNWHDQAIYLQRQTRIGRAWTTFQKKRLIVHKAVVIAKPNAPDSPSEAVAAVPGQLVGLDVATGQGWLRLVEVQMEGRGRQAASQWLRGLRAHDGAVFGTT